MSHPATANLLNGSNGLGGPPSGVGLLNGKFSNGENSFKLLKNSPKVRVFVIDPSKFQPEDFINFPDDGIVADHLNGGDKGFFNNVIETIDLSGDDGYTNGSNGVQANKRKHSPENPGFNNQVQSSEKSQNGNKEDHDTEGGGGKEPVTVTRAGRVSKSAPKLDGTNGKGSQAEKSAVPKKKKREPADCFRCGTCQKVYLGHTKLNLHFKKFPDHNQGQKITKNKKILPAPPKESNSIPQITINSSGSLSTSSIPQITLNTSSDLAVPQITLNVQIPSTQTLQLVPSYMSTPIQANQLNTIVENNGISNDLAQLQAIAPKNTPQVQTKQRSNLPPPLSSSFSAPSMGRSSSSTSSSASLSSLQSNSLTINKMTSEISMISNNNTEYSSIGLSSSSTAAIAPPPSNSSINSLRINSLTPQQQQQLLQIQMEGSRVTPIIQQFPCPSPSPSPPCTSSSSSMPHLNSAPTCLPSPSSSENSPAGDPFLSPIKLPKPKLPRILSSSSLNQLTLSLSNGIHTQNHHSHHHHHQMSSNSIQMTSSDLQTISDTLGQDSVGMNSSVSEFSFHNFSIMSSPPCSSHSNGSVFSSGLGLGPPPSLGVVLDVEDNSVGSEIMNEGASPSSIRITTPSPSGSIGRASSLQTPPLTSTHSSSSSDGIHGGLKLENSPNSRNFHNHLFKYSHLPHQHLPSPSTTHVQKSVWEFVEQKMKYEGINQMLLELSDVAERLAKIANDKIIPIRDEEEEKNTPIIQVNNPFLSCLMDLPIGTYQYREDPIRRIVPPPPPSGELSLSQGGVELDNIDKFLSPAEGDLPHLTNLEYLNTLNT